MRAATQCAATPAGLLTAPEPKRSICRFCAYRRHQCCLSGIAAPSAVGRFLTTRGRFSIRAREQLRQHAPYPAEPQAHNVRQTKNINDRAHVRFAWVRNGGEQHVRHRAESVMVRIPDTTRTSRNVSEVPLPDSCSATSMRRDEPVVCGGQALAYVYYEEEPANDRSCSPRMRHAGLQLTQLNCRNYCGAGQAGEPLKNENRVARDHWVKVKNPKARAVAREVALISRLLLSQQEQSYPRCSLPPRKRNAPVIQFGVAPLIRQIFPMCTGAASTSDASLPSDSVCRFPWVFYVALALPRYESRTVRF